MSADPNWRQFAREVAWSPTVSAAMRLLDWPAESIPPEGRPIAFRVHGARAEIRDESWFIAWRHEALDEEADLDSRFLRFAACSQCLSATPEQLDARGASANGDALTTWLRMKAATPQSAALREWLTMWGWEPPPKRARAGEPPPPMVV